MGNKSETCANCSGKGVGGDPYDGRSPDYVRPTIDYGKLTMVDYMGKEWVVERDETAEAAIERLEAERDRLHAEADLRIDELIAHVRRWYAGRPYKEKLPGRGSQYVNGVLVDLDAEHAAKHWGLTKAQQCAAFLRTLLADGQWQRSKDIMEKALAVGFKTNTIERARNLRNVELGTGDRHGYWRLPDAISDFRTSDQPASEIGNQKSNEGEPAAPQEAIA